MFYLQAAHREHYTSMLNRFMVKSIQDDSLSTAERLVLKPILQKTLDAAASELQAEPCLSELDLALLVEVQENYYLTHPFYQALAQCVAAQKQQLTVNEQSNYFQWMFWKRNTDFSTKILAKYQDKGFIPSCFVLPKDIVDGEALLHAIMLHASSPVAAPSH
jgi:hypothetical protein